MSRIAIFGAGGKMGRRIVRRLESAGGYELRCVEKSDEAALDEGDRATLTDWFGGVAKQDVVCALHRGPDAAYPTGEQLAREMYAPVRDVYRLAVEQMAILEPALVESLASTLIAATKEALDEVVRMGVPEHAARQFLMGHLRVLHAVIFGFADFEVSDGAKQAMASARGRIFRDDWKAQIFDRAGILKSVREIVDAE